MYVAVAAIIAGQALVLGRPALLLYAAVFVAVTAAFAHWYEEPALRPGIRAAIAAAPASVCAHAAALLGAPQLPARERGAGFAPPPRPWPRAAARPASGRAHGDLCEVTPTRPVGVKARLAGVALLSACASARRPAPGPYRERP